MKHNIIRLYKEIEIFSFKVLIFFYEICKTCCLHFITFFNNFRRIFINKMQPEYFHNPFYSNNVYCFQFLVLNKAEIFIKRY